MKRILAIGLVVGLFLIFGLVNLATQTTRVEGVERLEMVLDQPVTSPVWFSPLKVGIRNAVDKGVSANTIVLLLLFPLTAALVAFSRQVIGLNGFGIFIPALVSMAFLSTGVLAGLVLFLVIILTAITTRSLISKVKMPYLPRMAVLIWMVVMAVLGLLIISPVLEMEKLVGLGIYPVLLFIMLAESNVEAQITRTWQAAAMMTAETVVIAILASLIMGMAVVQEWALIHPELTVFLILGIDWLIGRYKGLRLLEIWRFGKII